MHFRILDNNKLRVFKGKNLSLRKIFICAFRFRNFEIEKIFSLYFLSQTPKLKYKLLN